MAKNTYYFEVKGHRGNVRDGVYSCQADCQADFINNHDLRVLRYYQISHRVWRQGPRGGVKIVKNYDYDLYYTTYITTNSKWMQEFAWAKLKAKPI